MFGLAGAESLESNSRQERLLPVKAWDSGLLVHHPASVLVPAVLGDSPGFAH